MTAARPTPEHRTTEPRLVDLPPGLAHDYRRLVIERARIARRVRRATGSPHGPEVRRADEAILRLVETAEVTP